MPADMPADMPVDGVGGAMRMAAGAMVSTIGGQGDGATRMVAGATGSTDGGEATGSRRDPQLGRMWAMRTAAGVDLGDADGGRAVERRSRGPRRRERRPAVEQHPAA